MIYTSYYNNKNLASSNLRLVAISRSVPKWYKGEIFLGLAPSWELISLKNKPELYTEIYNRDILSRLNARKIYSVLDSSILLCWEKPGEFCHRHIVAQWLEHATGNKVTEFTGAQLTLF